MKPFRIVVALSEGNLVSYLRNGIEYIKDHWNEETKKENNSKNS